MHAGFEGLEGSGRVVILGERKSGAWLFAIVMLAASAGLPGSAVRAESLPSALKSAYSGNPTIRAERARQRGTDEQIPQAESGWRPTVTASGDAGVKWTGTRPGRNVRTEPAGVSIGLSQPVFSGFKTVYGIKQARANVAAGQQNLLAVEQTVLFDAATAYLNVIRDRRIVSLRRKNVSVLNSQLAASNARFSVGEITRTDVAQSRARLALARAELAVARSNLAASVAFYVRAIGHAPGRLGYPAVSRRVPKTLKRALAIAARSNPQILAASWVEAAARHNVQVVKGDLLPSVSLDARYSVRHNPSAGIRHSQEGTIFGTITVPLYQAGRVHSRLREAKIVASQRRLQILEARRAVRESVVRSWNAYRAAGQTIASLSAQVAANRLAMDGVRQEAKVGSRTTLDVLDAERELVNSQVTLVAARRDLVIAGYQLVVAMGQMTARGLRLSVAYYNPDNHLNRVKGKFIGTSIRPY